MRITKSPQIIYCTVPVGGSLDSKELPALSGWEQEARGLTSTAAPQQVSNYSNQAIRTKAASPLHLFLQPPRIQEAAIFVFQSDLY